MARPASSGSRCESAGLKVHGGQHGPDPHFLSDLRACRGHARMLRSFRQLAPRGQDKRRLFSFRARTGVAFVRSARIARSLRGPRQLALPPERLSAILLGPCGGSSKLPTTSTSQPTVIVIDDDPGMRDRFPA